MAFNRDLLADRQGITKSDVAFGGKSTAVLQIQPVGHQVIEDAEDNATVGDTVEARVVTVRHEFAAAYTIIENKWNAQADRIFGAAHKAIIGIRAYSISSAVLGHAISSNGFFKSKSIAWA